jgi:hypothetical protein
MKKTMFVAIAILAIILGIVAYAGAATADVTVTATVASKLTMTVNTATIDLGETDPDAVGNLSAVGPQCNVRSNKVYDFGTTWPTNPGTAFSDTYVDTTGAARTASAGVNYNGNVVFNPDFELAEGLNTGVLQFSAAQQ